MKSEKYSEDMTEKNLSKGQDVIIKFLEKKQRNERKQVKILN